MGLGDAPGGISLTSQNYAQGTWAGVERDVLVVWVVYALSGNLLTGTLLGAQGRVWSGKRALEVGLVDALGGLSRAVAIAKRELKIPDGEDVRLIELSREMMSPLQLLSGGGASLGAFASIVQVKLPCPLPAHPEVQTCPK